MEIALIAASILGIIAVLVSWHLDRLKAQDAIEKKTQEDRIYKLSVLKEIQGKIAYTTDPEKVVDVIMANLRNFFSYSAAASMVIKNGHVIFQVYVEDNIGGEYIRRVEESMISSFEKLVGKMPEIIDKKFYGVPLNDAVKSIYSSSFHIPLIAKNKVLALIHLSSAAQNAYKNMEDLHELIDAASSSLTHFEQAIDSETQKFSSLIDSMNEGIIMIDDKNNLLAINDFAKKMLGITNMNASFFDVANVFPQNMNLAPKISEVILSKNPYIEKGINIGSKTADLFINPIGNYKVSLVLHDMTEYKKKEMLKEDLTHIMVHELRAPVTTIKDSAELILSTNTLEEERKLKFLEMIHTQAKKVLGQIGSILDTAKLDAGKLVLQKSPGDIEKLIQEQMQTFAPQAERKNISLNFETIAKSLPEISFDEIRISQVIDNLLSNSLKFTPENGRIKVEVDYKVIPPTEEFLSLDKYIVVSVTDTGVGIAPEQQKLLFSKYTQAQNTSEQVSTQGTGLGLYLVKGIVESHEGRIWVKSAQGVGTTFSFSLPAVDDAKTSLEAPKPTTTPLSKLSQTIN
ncbi:MAG: PAS domain-containing sensor histidine kinase [Candidatus Levybacteria bacterium]|nr:PAS domain-containing sensor histidine kinase [Candidatus Levybacteria bacterium]